MQSLNSQTFIQRAGSLPWLQDDVTGPRCQPDVSSPQPPTLFSLRPTLPFMFSDQTFAYVLPHFQFVLYKLYPRIGHEGSEKKLYLGFVVPCIFNHSNKNTQLDATVNRKIYCFVVQTLLNMFRALANRPRLRTLPPPHSYGNQRLQRQFDGLLMMGIVMPETC